MTPVTQADHGLMTLHPEQMDTWKLGVLLALVLGETCVFSFTFHIVGFCRIVRKDGYFFLEIVHPKFIPVCRKILLATVFMKVFFFSLS